VGHELGDVHGGAVARAPGCVKDGDGVDSRDAACYVPDERVTSGARPCCTTQPRAPVRAHDDGEHS
jgi:hypothetical protein